MDLQKEWNDLSNEVKSKDTSPAVDLTTLKNESKGLYEILHRNLRYKLNWIRIISVPALMAAFFATGPLRFLLLGIFLVYELARMGMVKKMKELPPRIEYSSVTKSILSQQLILIKEILRGEKIWGYIFIPIAGPIGLMAYYFFAKKNIMDLFQNPDSVYLIAGFVVLAFAGIKLAEKMNAIGYSEYITKLTKNMQELE